MIVKELCNHDVLLGRGTGPNEHEGNIRFRLLAAETLKTFSDSTTSPPMKMNKTKLAKKILEAVKARGGRFLRKLSKDEVASFRRKEKDTTEEKRSKDMFVVVPYEVALDKAKQSFRHQRRRGVVAGSGSRRCVSAALAVARVGRARGRVEATSALTWPAAWMSGLDCAEAERQAWEKDPPRFQASAHQREPPYRGAL